MGCSAEPPCGTETVPTADGKDSTSRLLRRNLYDLRNCLILTETPENLVESVYNAEGLRVKKTVTAVTSGETGTSDASVSSEGQTGGHSEKSSEIKYFLLDGTRIIMEMDGAQNITARNVYGSQLLLRTVFKPDETTNKETYEYLYNAHGDVVALLSDGVLAASYDYDPFGVLTSQTGTADNTLLYAGYLYDTETGLYYLNARMYDPVSARFLQRDTYAGEINDPLSLNRYTYCLNNPEYYTDPSGHFALSILAIALIGGAVVGVYAGAKEYYRQKYIENEPIVYGKVVFKGLSRGISTAIGMYCGLGFLQGLTGGAVLAGGAKSTAGLIAKKSVLQLSRKELRNAAVQAVGKATIGGILDGAAFSVAEQLFTTGDVRKLDWKQVRDEAILSGATALVFSSVTSILSYRLQVRRSKTPAGSMSKTDRAQYEEFLKRENMEAADGDGIAKAAKTGEGSGSRLIPGTDGVVTGGNSTKLGKNMLDEMGVPRSTKWTGHQAQHIIPAEMGGHPVLQKIGIDLDDASNGLFLRTPADDISAMSRHRGYHSTYGDFTLRG